MSSEMNYDVVILNALHVEVVEDVEVHPSREIISGKELADVSSQIPTAARNQSSHQSVLSLHPL
jgi:hypothetical protein